VTGDLLAYVNHVYDLIVANLPYVAVPDRAGLSREVLHDPEVALFGGERGDEVVRRLIEAAPAKLKPGGLLAAGTGARAGGRSGRADGGQKIITTSRRKRIMPV